MRQPGILRLRSKRASPPAARSTVSTTASTPKPASTATCGHSTSVRARSIRFACRALDAAGLMPGITAGFRDNYRQTIATGQKASSDRSYHGGSFHGGYGHGQAADIVSVKGQTRADRLVSSDVLWRWIDTHEKELGIGRPYLDRDAPHVGPLDGREYLAHRGEPKSQAGKARLADRARHGDKNHQAEKKKPS